MGRIAFGPFDYDSDSRALLRDGAPVAIGYRGALLLGVLLERLGQTLSKSELLDAAWPGLAVEENNLSVQLSGLRKALGKRADGSDWIIAVPRSGYRFAPLDGPELAATEPMPSIAVLPYVSLGADASDDFLASGLSEDLITRLSRFRWLRVASRGSSFSFSGKNIDPRQVGRELKVRYVLEGSVRRSPELVRVTSRLSDTGSGDQIWADTQSALPGEFLAMQDQIAEAVLTAIEPKLFEAEHERFKDPRAGENLGAWGYVMRAMPHVWTWGSLAEIREARRLLNKSLEADPGYPRALSLLAWSYAAEIQLGTVDYEPFAHQSLAFARDALRTAPLDPWAHFAAGYVHMVRRDFDAAIRELEEAIDLNPSMAVAHVITASAYGYHGQWMEGLHHLALAERMSPRDFSQPALYGTRGLCHFVKGDYEAAIAEELRATELRPDFGTAMRTLAAAAGLAGRDEIARDALQRCRQLQPGLSLDWVLTRHAISDPEVLERFAKGLAAAGLE